MKTGNKPQKPYCALGSVIPKQPDKEEAKRLGWINHRILVVSMSDDRLGWFDKQVIEQIGKKLYE